MSRTLPPSYRPQWMADALALATRARGRTAPNPMVGCVVARGGRVVGQGWHARAGQAHAEVVALGAAGRQAREADLYVTLEPCHHVGRTGPCTEAIVAAGVRRLFVGAGDPDARVQGRGVRYLRRRGVAVYLGCMAEQAARLNAPYNQVKRTGLAYVVAKVAQSVDGCVATRTGASQWITGPLARAHGHRLRNAVDAIIVGSGTVRADDPQLTCRLPGGRDPVRVVLASQADVSPRAAVLAPNPHGRTLVLVGPHAPQRRIEALCRAGAEVCAVPLAGRAKSGHQAADRLDLAAALRLLAARNLHAVLLEGGPTLLGSFFDAGLVRRLHAFVAPVVIGGSGARRSVLGEGADRLAEAHALHNVTVQQLGADWWLRADVVANVAK